MMASGLLNWSAGFDSTWGAFSAACCSLGRGGLEGIAHMI